MTKDQQASEKHVNENVDEETAMNDTEGTPRPRTRDDGEEEQTKEEEGGDDEKRDGVFPQVFEDNGDVAFPFLDSPKRIDEPENPYSNVLDQGGSSGRVAPSVTKRKPPTNEWV